MENCTLNTKVKYFYADIVNVNKNSSYQFSRIDSY